MVAQASKHIRAGEEVSMIQTNQLNQESDPAFSQSKINFASPTLRAYSKVTDNYFPPAMVMPRDERRDWLSSHYMFHCCCNACIIDQPNMRFNYDEM